MVAGLASFEPQFQVHLSIFVCVFYVINALFGFAALVCRHVFFCFGGVSFLVAMVWGVAMFPHFGPGGVGVAGGVVGVGWGG